MARVAVGVHMSDIFMPVAMYMNEIMRFEESEVLQYLLCVSVPDLSLVFPHHHYPVRNLRNDMDILGSRNDCAAFPAKCGYRVYQMP